MTSGFAPRLSAKSRVAAMNTHCEVIYPRRYVKLLVEGCWETDTTQSPGIPIPDGFREESPPARSIARIPSSHGDPPLRSPRGSQSTTQPEVDSTWNQYLRQQNQRSKGKNPNNRDAQSISDEIPPGRTQSSPAQPPEKYDFIPIPVELHELICEPW